MASVYNYPDCPSVYRVCNVTGTSLTASACDSDDKDTLISDYDNPGNAVLSTGTNIPATKRPKSVGNVGCLG